MISIILADGGPCQRVCMCQGTYAITTALALTNQVTELAEQLNDQLHKPAVIHLIKKSNEVYGIRSFITVGQIIPLVTCPKLNQSNQRSL